VSAKPDWAGRSGHPNRSGRIRPRHERGPTGRKVRKFGRMGNASGKRHRADDRQPARDAQPSDLGQPNYLEQPSDLGMIAHCRSSPTRVTRIPNAARGAVPPQIRTKLPLAGALRSGRWQALSRTGAHVAVRTSWSNGAWAADPSLVMMKIRFELHFKNFGKPRLKRRLNRR
jgi:hypothetical protein